ncbi:hypothetical protein NSMM_500013 [Nitrosomonas mobilis]|uniref:Uncharacterized protein n=1 Tax=Nitrosomonas mobilis TaxID=51642 RepID=A0A1G5SG86_9PROT|nr:hypothetical protein NSMM_500013 [Nitrosomonas mobilis]
MLIIKNYLAMGIHQLTYKIFIMIFIYLKT